MERCEEMKLGKKIIATVIAVVLVLTVSMVMASAADYTVKPGGSVDVTLVKNVEGLDGSVSFSGGGSVRYSASEGTVENGKYAMGGNGTKTVTATVTAPSGASVGDVYTVSFSFRTYDIDGNLADTGSVSYTVEVVSGGSSGGNSGSSGGSSSSGSGSSGPAVKVDLSKLQELIDKASNLKKDGYTADSWNKMVDALTKAQAALSSTNQDEIDAAAKALGDALNGLVKMDYSKLLDAIARAKELGKDNEVNSLWLALLDALTNGNLMLASDDQAQVDAAAKQINDLIDQLLDGSKFCNISIHKVWPILFFISLAANVVLVVVLVKKNGTKKKNQVDNTPLVDYDISDDE